LDFTDDFTKNTATSVHITVGVLPAFDRSPSLSFATSTNQAVIEASNISGDMLTLIFTIPNLGTLADFSSPGFGAIVGGDAIFGGLTGVLLGPTGTITADPQILDAVTAPEPSTWVMMLLGFIGLGLAAKGRRAIRFLAGKA
jgi:hypothetical protein